MIILAIDTSTPVISVAVTELEVPLASVALSRGRSNAAHILSAIDAVFAQAGLEIGACDAVACAVGPGSFTGLRVGLATAQGLAEGRGLPVVGVPTLEAYAHAMQGAEGLLCPMVDARKQEVYVAGYQWEEERLVELWPPAAYSPERLALQLGGRFALLIGEGAAAYRTELEASLGRKARFGPTDLSFSNAIRVARLGAERLAQGAGADPATLKPLYGRPSEAELARAQRQDSPE